MQTTVNVVCYKSKTLANGNHPLMIRLCQGKKLKYISLGMSIFPEFWDFEKERPKRNCPNKEQIENIIAKKTTEYRKQILEFKMIEKDFSVSKLVETVDKPLRRITVDSFFLEVIDEQMKQDRIGNANSFKFALNSLRAFSSVDIPFSEIDANWLKKYEAWMRAKGNSENTLGVRFRALRAIYNRAIQEGIVKRDYYPFNEFKVSKLKETTKKRAITKADIQKLISFDASTVENQDSNLLELSRDMFLFSYFGCGINFIDIAYLRKSNIENGRITYERHKTGKRINFLLTAQALEILSKYAHPKSEYLFPILSDAIHKTELQKHYRIRKITKRVNKSLKTIGEQIGINISLTTYVARHSFATVLKRSGVNIALISEALGHSDLATTQIYLDSFENSQIDAAMSHLL